MPKLDNYEQEVDAQIGERIRLRRVDLGISQAELADRIGMSFQQVQKYERGANRIASSILLRVSQALDCLPGDFLNIRAARVKAKKQPKESLAEREIISAMQRLRQIKSSAVRKRILMVLETLLREAEKSSSPPKAAKTKAPPKPVARAKTKQQPARAAAKRRSA